MAFQQPTWPDVQRLFDAASQRWSETRVPLHAPWARSSSFEPAYNENEAMPDWAEAAAAQEGEEDDLFTATAGLPEEILLLILLELEPSARAPLAGVCTTWMGLVQKSWQQAWGSVVNDMGFHVLVPSRILRQALPVATWSIPDFGRMPRGVTLLSPPFEIPTSSEVLGRPVQWRLRLTRARAGDDSDAVDDLSVHIEAVRPRDVTSEGLPFTIFCRFENPASYAWGHSETKKVTLSTSQPVVKALTHVHSVLADPNKGYLAPSAPDTITISASVMPESHEYVTVFSLADCRRNSGPDLLSPSAATPVLALPRKWNTPPSSGPLVLKREYARARPDLDSHSLQFWRVIMRRNNTFRPVSPELKAYEEPFYAVLAHEVREMDKGKCCLFVKYYDGQRLRFLDELFLDPEETFLGLIRRLGRAHDAFTLFEEVHSRRVDEVTDLTKTLRSHDVGDGDILVLVARQHAAQVVPHYQHLVYTSPLVTVSPNMWHA
jgi:hypothetical protein